MAVYWLVCDSYLTRRLQVLLAKAREKGQHDNTFTDSVLQRLFCNIEDILDLHRRLVAELKACVKGGAVYGTAIAGVYSKFVSARWMYCIVCVCV